MSVFHFKCRYGPCMCVLKCNSTTTKSITARVPGKYFYMNIHTHECIFVNISHPCAFQWVIAARFVFVRAHACVYKRERENVRGCVHTPSRWWGPLPESIECSEHHTVVRERGDFNKCSVHESPAWTGYALKPVTGSRPKKIKKKSLSPPVTYIYIDYKHFKRCVIFITSFWFCMRVNLTGLVQI